MKKAHVLAGILLILALLGGVAFAQKSHEGPGMSSCAPAAGVLLERLDLTEEQRVAFERIEKAYRDRIHDLRAMLMTRRLELQSVFRNPLVDEETVRAKSREVIEAQNQCQQTAMDCQIEIRRVLTPEQLRNWSTARDSCMPWNRRK